jgi:hypothetical protein
MLAGALTAGASASTVQFSVGGVPVDAGQVIEVAPSDDLLVGIWVTPDQPMESYTIDMFLTGPWPQPDVVICDPPWGVFPPPWDPGLSDVIWIPSWGVYEFSGFVGDELFVGPGVVAEFYVHIPDVPYSTILNMEYDFTELVGPAGYYDDMSEHLPLVLHVTPEPVSLGLLALGGLVALRRRIT